MKIKSVLVSQPKPETDKSPYYDIAKQYNVKIDFRPFVKVEGISAKEFRSQKINIDEYMSVIFNSRASVDHYFRICEETKVPIRDDRKYFCISESIAYYLQKYVTYRKRKIFYGDGALSNLMLQIKKFADDSYLVPLTEGHKQDIPDTLKKDNIKYTIAILYRTVSSNMSDMESIGHDIVLFFSPAGVMSLKQNFPNFDQNKENVFIGAFGPTTAATVEKLGFRLDIQAPT
ncbi:MAG: uroporphyrinogen-III synthase, partial [Bacteroidales bacterium]|nr:uroporphyrinogen-III synthase [Bacteroidales bacterium]